MRGEWATVSPVSGQPTAAAQAPVWSPSDLATDRSGWPAQGNPPPPAAINPVRMRADVPVRPEPEVPWSAGSTLATPGAEPWLTRDLPATYWWQSLVMLLLVPPVGVAALYFSWQVTRRAGLGDWPGAVRASRLARTFCLLGAFVFALAVVVYTGTNPK